MSYFRSACSPIVPPLTRVTHESPAYLLYGRELRGPHHVGLLDKTPPSGDVNRLTKDGKIYYEKFMARMRVAWNLAYHSTRHQQDADRQDRDRSADTSPSYAPNDRVLLRVPQSDHTHKLASQWEGPYRIASPDGVLPNGNYRLTDLRDRRRREEVSGDRLRLYLTVTDADRIQPDEYLVERILDRRGTGRTREYRVKWRGYPIREATWEPRGPLMVRCGDMVREADGANPSDAPTDASADPQIIPPALTDLVVPNPRPPQSPLPAGPGLPQPPIPANPESLQPPSPATVAAARSHYRDSHNRLHSSKAAFIKIG